MSWTLSSQNGPVIAWVPVQFEALPAEVRPAVPMLTAEEAATLPSVLPAAYQRPAGSEPVPPGTIRSGRPAPVRSPSTVDVAG